MPHHVRASTLILCLLLLAGGAAVAQDELPGFVPFRTIAGDGSVSITVAGGDVYFRLGFDADFRLDPQSNGIQPGDDVQIITSLAYPTPTPQANPLELAISRLVVRLAVAGECFERRGRALLFEALDGGAVAGCVEVDVEISDDFGVIDGRLDIIQSLTVELKPLGQRGRWKLRSIAAFADPGFPFPVAGFTYDPARADIVSGVTLVVGDDGGLSPFRTVGFRTLAP